MADRGPMAYLWSVLDAPRHHGYERAAACPCPPTPFLNKAGEVTSRLCKHSAPDRLQGEQNRLVFQPAPAAESRL